MEKLKFSAFAGENLSAEDAMRKSAELRVQALNNAVGKDDGTGIDCPLCKNKGVVVFLSDDTGNITARPCRCAEARKTIRRLMNIGVWEHAQDCKFKTFRKDTETQKTMLKTARAFASAPQGPWLAMLGQSGCGKTHLTTAAFVSLTRRYGLDGQYMQWNTELRKMKATVLEDGGRALLDKFKNCKLLLIDDLFKCKSGSYPSDADVRLAFEMIDHRSNNHLVTILSSEKTFDQLLELDQAIAGRIRECCGPYLVSVAEDISKNFRLQDHSA